jgi:hypothetical protein
VEYLIGVCLALAVCALGTFAGLERDRAYYPTISIVTASYYGLFAILGGSMSALATESVVFAGFLLVSILGFKRNLWLVAAALCSHGIFDCIHGHLISNPGLPAWWPMFCLTFDVTAAVYLGSLLRGKRVARIDGR